MSKPTGTKNVTVFAYTHPSRCPACQSTSREPYDNRQVDECATTLGDGMPITHVVRQNTRCRDCGQCRVDAIYHFLPNGGKPDAKNEAKPQVAGDIREELIASLSKPQAI